MEQLITDERQNELVASIHTLVKEHWEETKTNNELLRIVFDTLKLNIPEEIFVAGVITKHIIEQSIKEEGLKQLIKMLTPVLNHELKKDKELLN